VGSCVQARRCGEGPSEEIEQRGEMESVVDGTLGAEDQGFGDIELADPTELPNNVLRGDFD